MELSEEDRIRVEAQVERMVADLRIKPTQEKDDLLGVELAAMPPAEREHVTTVLLGMLAAERGGPGRSSDDGTERSPDDRSA